MWVMFIVCAVELFSTFYFGEFGTMIFAHFNYKTYKPLHPSAKTSKRWKTCFGGPSLAGRERASIFAISNSISCLLDILTVIPARFALIRASFSTMMALFGCPQFVLNKSSSLFIFLTISTCLVSVKDGPKEVWFLLACTNKKHVPTLSFTRRYINNYVMPKNNWQEWELIQDITFWHMYF